MIWKERKWLLIGLGILLLINVIFFVTYRVRYENRIDSLSADLETAQGDLQAAIDRRREAQEILSSVDRTSDDLAQIYGDWWSTRPERLAPLIVELQTLARKSGLNPPSRNYSWAERDTIQNVGAQSLTVSFRVEGTYKQIRTLINLIELSPHFVVIEQVSLADATGGGRNLGMTLSLKTLFRTEVSQEQPST